MWRPFFGSPSERSLAAMAALLPTVGARSGMVSSRPVAAVLISVAVLAVLRRLSPKVNAACAVLLQLGHALLAHLVSPLLSAKPRNPEEITPEWLT